MSTNPVSADEKSLLATRARQAVERAQRAGDAKTAQGAAGQGAAGPQPGLFSGEGVERRLNALEQRVEQLGREYGAALNTLSFGVERLETRCARLAGEVDAVRALSSKSESRYEAARAESQRAAATLADRLVAETGALVAQVDGLAKDVLAAQSQLIKLVSEPEPGRGVRRFGRDG